MKQLTSCSVFPNGPNAQEILRRILARIPPSPNGTTHSILHKVGSEVVGRSIKKPYPLRTQVPDRQIGYTSALDRVLDYVAGPSRPQDPIVPRTPEIQVGLPPTPTNEIQITAPDYERQASLVSHGPETPRPQYLPWWIGSCLTTHSIHTGGMGAERLTMMQFLFCSKIVDIV